MVKLYQTPGRIILILLCFLSTQAWSQARTVTGIVTASEDGSVVPGANVLEKGTANGTVTDVGGKFSIVVNDNATLVFSFVGYASQEVVVGSQATINIALAPDVANLAEVVVIGYGSVKKSDATGAVGLVDSKAFNKGVVNSPQELIMGKMAGVSVITNSGAPGNASTVRIRGGSSLSANNDPLYVIDGVPISTSNLGGSPNILATINPNDIESYVVLKDASATAIYGLRAANGVIIITTKRGGKDMKITYTGTGTAATSPKRVSTYDGPAFSALVKKLYPGNTTVTGLLGTANTDWQKQIYKDVAYSQDHNLTLSGTAAKTPYRVSYGYNNSDGILKTYNFKRQTIAVSLDPSLLNDKLKMSINVKALYNNNNFSDQSAVGDAVVYDPTKPVYNGNTAWRGFTTWTTGGKDGAAIDLATANPLAKLLLTDNTSIAKRSIGNVKFDYELPGITGLHAILNLGYDYSTTKGHNNVVDKTQWIYLPTEAGGKLNPYSASMKNQLLDFYFNYNKTLPSAKSKFDVTAGYSWSHFWSQGGDSTMNAKGEGVTRVNVYKTENYLLAFFGRLNYTLNDKYLLTATLRDDATSRFDKDVRWGLFPSVALGWKINQEDFMRTFESLSDLKLRMSYGVTGQQDISGNDYPYISTYTISDNAARYPFGTTFYNTIRPDGYNQKIKWETTATTNVGVDFGFFGNRITGSVDVYEKKSSNLINYVPPAAGTNFTASVISNVGNITNKGIEIGLSSEVISNEKVTWIVGYNITYNKNKITKLTLNDDPNFYVPAGGVGGTTSGNIQAQKVGYSRNSFYVYQQVYGADGKPLEDVYVDRNHDGQIDDKDLYIYKKPDANIFMGINSRLSVGNWDFAFSGRASLGNYVYNNVAANSTYHAIYSSLGFLSNVSTQAGKTGFTTANNTRFSDFYIENASFFRMDNINFGYTWKNLASDKLRLRVGAGSQNVFVITKYSGIDPEVSGGIDNNFFPRTRSYFLSVNLQF